MNPPALLRKFISLFWLKKDCFQLAISKTQTWKQRKEFKEKKVEDCAWTAVVDENLLKFLESVEHKSVWYPFENGHAQSVAFRAKALRTPDPYYDRKKFHLRTSIVKTKGVWWLLEMNYDLNKENVSTSLEEEAEVLVSVFLPSERTYFVTTLQLTPEIVEEFLDTSWTLLMAVRPREENQLACVVFMLMTCSLLEPQSFWRGLRKLSSHNSRLVMKM